MSMHGCIAYLWHQVRQPIERLNSARQGLHLPALPDETLLIRKNKVLTAGKLYFISSRFLLRLRVRNFKVVCGKASLTFLVRSAEGMLTHSLLLDIR